MDVECEDDIDCICTLSPKKWPPDVDTVASHTSSSFDNFLAEMLPREQAIKW